MEWGGRGVVTGEVVPGVVPGGGGGVGVGAVGVGVGASVMKVEGQGM